MNKLRILIVVLVLLALAAAWYYFAVRQGQSGPYDTLIGVNTSETKVVDVTDCKLNPDVAAVGTSTKVRFVNNGDENRVLYFGRTGGNVVPSRGFLEMTFDFYKIPGPRKYDCDGNKGAGIISVFFRPSTTTAATSTIAE